MDEGKSAPSAAEAAGVNESTARRVGQRYNKGGLEHALHDAPRPGAKLALDERQEASIVAMVCSKAPDGAARWSISLIAKEAVRRDIVASVSDSTIGRLLKRHELKPWREKNVVRSGD
jgi:transposase